MNVAYGILNWNRDITPIFNSIVSVGGPFIICTNTNKMTAANVHNIDAESSVAKSLNKILDKAKELSVDYLFILEDDMIVKDVSVFEKYIKLSQKFDIGLLFYGFDKANRIFNHKPNPCISITMKDNEEVIFNRFISSGCMLFDLKKNTERFNEEFQSLEIEEYVFRCHTAGLIPFNGFYVDLPKSWEYFEKLPLKALRPKLVDIMKEDKKIMDRLQTDNKMEFNVDKLFKYLIDKGF